MENWLKERLSTCLDFPVPDEMIKFILSMKSTEEVDDYFQTLLNYELSDHKTFINDFKQKFFGKLSNKENNNKNIMKKQGGKSNASSDNKKDKSSTADQQASASSSLSATTKKKTKFVSLYTKDGQMNDVILLKGRHRCDCQAQKHKLINNCIKCGRIVCEQEGSGPCLFCGELVCSEEELKMIKTSSKKGDNLKKSLMEQNRPKGWEEALAQRNRLLEYDRTSEKRTTVIDDESDYFKANSVWLSNAERKKLEKLEEELREKKHSRRLNQKVTIDFSGREIIEEPQLAVDFEDHILKEIAKSVSTNNTEVSGTSKKGKNKNKNNQADDIHPGLDVPAPIYIRINTTSNNSDNNIVKNDGNEYDGVYNRVQDKELLEIQDMRHCLSMHQPWASLLIAGIKKHEGRTWYTSHRGRLWIASTAKPVDMDEVKRMENFYRVIYNDDNIKFPTQYPSGCLLGCVSVQDCIPQEEYRKIYPDGESESPFVFICTNPQELPIRFPVKGSHKIYKLDPKIHTAAVKSLQRIAKLKAENEI